MPHNHSHLTHPKYRPDIDGLRAIAILAVVGFHAFPGRIHGGFIGVDIFFVISGYLISTIIMGSLERNSFSFVDFYIRRINRIFPALLVVLIACFAFGWFALFADEYKQLGKHIAGGAGFVSNYVFWRESGYFDNAAETKPLLHLWSLGIEEQFYILWPPLLWFVWKQKFNLLTITILIAVISFGLNVAKVNGGHLIDAFYSPQTRFWELLIGSVLAYITLHHQHMFANVKHCLDVWLGKIIYAHAPEANGKTLRNVQSLLGVTFLGIGFILITKEGHFPGWWAVLPTLGAVLVISAGTQAWFNRVVLSSRVLVWFGLISFPLYLWHWVLLSFARIVESETPSFEIRVAAVLLSIILAWLTYRFVEKPIRFGANGNKKTVALLVLMVVSGCAGFLSYIQNGLEFRSPLSSDRYISQTIEQQFTASSCKDYVTRINHCARYGNNNDSVVFLIGDSHVRHTFEIIKEQTSQAGFDLIAFSSGGCPLLLNTNMSNVPDCAEKNQEALDLFKNDKHKTKIIAITAEYTTYAESGTMQFTEGAVAHFPDSLFKTISALQGSKIVFVEQIPPIPFDPKKCINRPFRMSGNKGCEITRIESNKLLEKSRRQIHDVVSKFSNVHLYSFDSYLCDSKNCNAIGNNEVLYYDQTHLNPVGVEYVRNQSNFREFLQRISAK